MNLSIANFEEKKKAWAHKHQKGIVLTRKISFWCAVVFAVLWVIGVLITYVPQ